MVRNRPAARLIVAVLALALVLLTAVCERAADRARSRQGAEDDVSYLPRTPVLRLLAFGHPEAMADAIFVRVVGSFPVKIDDKNDPHWLRRQVQSIVALDPWFKSAYLFGARGALSGSGTPTAEEVETSSRFYRLGMKQFPSDWEMPFGLACNYLFNMHGKDPQQVRKWRLQGAHLIRRAALLRGGPAWLPGLAVSIMSKEGQEEASIRYLEEAYLTAPDEKAREEIGRLLLAKRVKGMARLRAAQEKEIQGWQKTLPYAPQDLYVLLGDPPSPRLDLPWILRGTYLGSFDRGGTEDDLDAQPVGSDDARPADHASPDGGR